MLNFLRRLRRTSSGQYLKYAVGEIILVVIGIFIAVQINNWNQGRKEDQILADLLELLKGDLKEDLITLKGLDSTYSQIEARSNILLDQFKTLRPIEVETSEYFINLLLETGFKSQQNAYEILKESGQFSNLNLRLQNELMHYYSTVEEIKEREDISNAFIRNRYEPVIFGRYPSFFSRFNPAPPVQEVYANDPRPLDNEVLKTMFNDNELEVLSFGRRYQNNKQWAQYKLAIEEIQKMLDLLNNY